MQHLLILLGADICNKRSTEAAEATAAGSQNERGGGGGDASRTSYRHNTASFLLQASCGGLAKRWCCYVVSRVSLTIRRTRCIRNMHTTPWRHPRNDPAVLMAANIGKRIGQ